MAEEKKITNEKDQVKKVMEDFFYALSAKDIKGMMSHYASDVVVFDCKLPFQTKGAVAWRHTWEASLPYFPKDFKIETRDLVITVSGTMAIAHHLFRITGPEKKHPAMQTWMRATTGFKLQQGKWKIIHEHSSVPFNPETLQAQFTLEP